MIQVASHGGDVQDNRPTLRRQGKLPPLPLRTSDPVAADGHSRPSTWLRRFLDQTDDQQQNDSTDRPADDLIQHGRIEKVEISEEGPE